MIDQKARTSFRCGPRFVACFVLLVLDAGATPVFAQDLTLEALASTRARPLFSPTRRPAESAPAVLASVPSVDVKASEPVFAVTGVLLGTGNAMAIVTATDHRSTTVRIGDNIDDWRVTEIRPRSIVVERGQVVREVSLKVSQSPAEMLPAD